MSEPLAEEEAKTYTYTTIGEAQVAPIEADDEDDFDEEEYEEPTHEERSKHKRSWSFDSVMKGINSLFGSNDSGDDY